MKVLIFGATGGTGQHLVAQALEQGHEVSAFVRRPKMFSQKNAKLNVVKGDVLDIASVENAVLGHDVVIIALGISNIMDKSRLREKGTINIVQAMTKSGIKRLICQSAFGTGDSFDLLPLYYKYFLAPLFMKNLYRDHSGQEACIKKSNLDWVIVRPGVLTDGERTGTYKYGFSVNEGRIKAKISRADAAEFMLKQLTNDTLLQKMPFVSY